MEGGNVLFVGTKRQAQDTIAEEATRCGMPYVTERWLGGTLTNWVTIRQRIQELERLEHLRDSGEINRLTKKEGLLIEREIRRLETRLSGIRTMKNLPDLLYVVDVGREDTAVHEANLKSIPVIALVDTNSNPHGIDYVIPSNDDAIRAIKLLVGKIADAVVDGKNLRKDVESEEAQAEELARTVEQPRRVRAVDEEVELEDEDLLGEATLAKLGSKRSAAEDEDEDEESDDEDEKPSVKAGRAPGGEKGAAEVLDEGEVPEEDKE
jgi:small subunit ribosomal protein S2